MTYFLAWSIYTVDFLILVGVALLILAQLAGTVEYTDWIPAVG